MMSNETLKGFSKIVQSALRDDKTDYALSLFKDAKNSEEVKNGSWDLIPVISEYLTEEIQLNHCELFKCCKHLLDLICDHSNPEEALLQFVAEVEETKNNVKFVALLDPLSKVICRISHKKVNSWAWSFNAIQTYLAEQCEILKFENLEGMDMSLIEMSLVQTNIISLYAKVIEFYNKTIYPSTQNEELNNVVKKFLIQLLGQPLCYLDMKLLGTPKSDGRGIVDDVVGKIFETMNDPLDLIQSEQDDFSKPNDLSVANLFYLVYVEGVCLQFIPKIYRSNYVFQSSVSLLCVLLETNNSILIEKALKLANQLLAPLKDEKLSYLYLESNAYLQFFKLLAQTIIYDESERLRQMALQCLHNYILVFEVKGVYLIISYFLTELSHSGLKGYIITLYKDLLNREWNENSISVYFKGDKLFSLLRKCCNLSEQEETNLLNNSDQIVATLNFLRYLCLKDKNNVTQFWTFSSKLEQIYLKPLKKGIELSRGRFELEIQNIQIEDCSQKEHVSVIVSGKELPKVNKEERISALKESLIAFDVMDSLLSRVMELSKNILL